MSPAALDWGINGEEVNYGGWVSSLSVNRADPHTVYRAMNDMFQSFDIDRSDDGGATWTSMETPRISARPYQLVDDPANPDYVYATVDDPVAPGVLVSRDGGQTWRKNDLPATAVAIAADPDNPDHIWLGGPSGLYVSSDEGQTVTRLSSTPVSALSGGLPNLDVGSLAASPDGRWLYAGTEGGSVYRTAFHAGG